MPRAPRIEYEGAVYHIMARGNRREPIVFDDSDRELFVATLEEACGRTGWEVFAWVLMDNHYHFILRTPEPNLVAGMQWFQNAYTRRLNSRHKLWGHLFGGRYRSILIENKDEGGKLWRDYLRTAIDYVHLNPGRAGLVDGVKTFAREYPWSSLSQSYAKSPKNRQKWVCAREGLDLLGYKDTVAGRRRYCERIDGWLGSERTMEPEVDGVGLKDRVKRGWFWGSEIFKEKMLERLEIQGKRTSRDYRSSPAQRDHMESQAQKILKEAESHYKMSLEDIGKKRIGEIPRDRLIISQSVLANTWRSVHIATMRQARIRGVGKSYYHCLSRVVDRNFVLHDEEKEHFVALMRKLEAFHGMRVVTYCIMSNHFHLLIEEPDEEISGSGDIS